MLVGFLPFALLIVVTESTYKILYEKSVFSLGLASEHDSPEGFQSLFGFSLYKSPHTDNYYIGAPLSKSSDVLTHGGGVFRCVLPSSLGEEGKCNVKLEVDYGGSLSNVNHMIGSTVTGYKNEEKLIICAPNLGFDSSGNKNYGSCNVHSETGTFLKTLWKDESTVANIGMAFGRSYGGKCSLIISLAGVWDEKSYGGYVCDSVDFNFSEVTYIPQIRSAKPVITDSKWFYFTIRRHEEATSRLYRGLWQEGTDSVHERKTRFVQYQFGDKVGWQVLEMKHAGVSYMYSSAPGTDFGRGRVYLFAANVNEGYVNGRTKDSFFGISMSFVEGTRPESPSDLVVSSAFGGKGNKGTLSFYRVTNTFSNDNLIQWIEVADMGSDISNIYKIYSTDDLNGDGRTDLLVASFSTSKIYGLVLTQPSSLDYECVQSVISATDMFSCGEHMNGVCVKVSYDLKFTLIRDISAESFIDESEYEITLLISEHYLDEWNVKGNGGASKHVTVTRWPFTQRVEFVVNYNPSYPSTNELKTYLKATNLKSKKLTTLSDITISLHDVSRKRCKLSVDVSCSLEKGCSPVISIQSIMLEPALENLYSNMYQDITIKVEIESTGDFLFHMNVTFIGTYSYTVKLLECDNENLKVGSLQQSSYLSGEELKFSVLGLITSKVSLTMKLEGLFSGTPNEASSIVKITNPVSKIFIIQSRSDKVVSVVFYKLKGLISRSLYVVGKEAIKKENTFSISVENTSPLPINDIKLEIKIDPNTFLEYITSNTLKCDEGGIGSCVQYSENGKCYVHQCAYSNIDAAEIKSGYLSFILNETSLKNLKEVLTVEITGKIKTEADEMRGNVEEVMKTFKIIKKVEEKEVPTVIIVVAVISSLAFCAIIVVILKLTGAFKKLTFQDGGEAKVASG